MFDVLKNYKRPVLFWSSGLDSTLILALLREANAEFDIVQQRQFWTREQKKRADDLIKKWNLKVFSYAPSGVSFIGNENEISVVQTFVTNDVQFPMLSDVVEGTRCIADLDGLRLNKSPMEWDLVIVGSRADDRHYAFEGQVIPSEMWTVGKTTFYAPLFEKSREWVKAELTLRGLDADEVSDTENTGNISLCSNCLNGTEDVWCPRENAMIPPVQWDRTLNLINFRQAYGLPTL